MEKIISDFMQILRDLMASGKLNEFEIEALEFAHDLMFDEFMLEAQRTQDEWEEAKKQGKMN